MVPCCGDFRLPGKVSGAFSGTRAKRMPVPPRRSPYIPRDSKGWSRLCAVTWVTRSCPSTSSSWGGC